MNKNQQADTPMSWVTTWGTAEENFIATPEGMPEPLADTTVRQIIRVTSSGDEMKLRLSNRYGKSDVVIRSMHVAKQIKADQSAIDLSTDTVVKALGWHRPVCSETVRNRIAETYYRLTSRRGHE